MTWVQIGADAMVRADQIVMISCNGDDTSEITLACGVTLTVAMPYRQVIMAFGFKLGIPAGSGSH